MRVLIVAAVLACAAAVPSGLLGAPYAHGGLLAGHGLAVGHAAPLALAAPLAVGHAIGPAAPTISPGDIAGAAIDAHVEVSDHVRAATDQASELHGQAVNAAEENSWQAVDAVKTVEAQWDGAAAGAAPILAKQLAGHAAPIAHAAPLAAAYGAPLAHAAYGAPLAHAAYAAPVAASKSVVTQSLSQTHPAPLLHAAPVLAHAAPLAYGAGLGHAGLGHVGLSHGLAHGW